MKTQVLKNIDKIALDNTYFRHVLDTGEHTQIVVMSINIGEEIGEETHTDNDQVLYLLQGTGKAIIEKVESSYEKGDIILVKAGTLHNFVNTGNTVMKIITMYSPAHHPTGTIHKTKAEADNAGY